MTHTETLGHIVEQLADVRARCPELRFGQLIATIGMLAEDETGHSLWDVEDADFTVALQRFRADIGRRGSAPAEQCIGPNRSPDQALLESTAPQPPQQPR